jgi:hypothetical protein
MPEPYETGTEVATTPITGVVSFLSSHEKKGPWRLPRRTRALSVLGNVELDLRIAEVGYGVSDIEVMAVMGSVEIIIPPELAFECDGDALMGTFNVQWEGKVNTAAVNRDRVVRISGNAYMGAVTVRVKGPDQALMERLERTLAKFRR